MGGLTPPPAKSVNQVQVASLPAGVTRAVSPPSADASLVVSNLGIGTFAVSACLFFFPAPAVAPVCSLLASGAASPTSQFLLTGCEGAATLLLGNVGFGTYVSAGAIGSSTILKMDGYVVFTAVGGQVAVGWGSNANGNVTLHQGSWLQINQVG